jgi:hypothetical protein
MPDYRFKIDAPYTPATMPMARLAEYMAQIAAILGEPRNVHFVGLELGSTVLVQKIDAEAAPKVRDRVERTRRGEGPREAVVAERTLNQMLRDDNGKATLNEDSAEIFVFPGREIEQPIKFATFSQDGTLDGVVIRLGGRNETVPVILESGTRAYQCQANRSVAKRLAAHIFEDEVRAIGTGRWYIDANGTWILDRFTISDFIVLDSEPLTAVVSALRGIRGSDWENVNDPWADLMEIRNGPPETR